MTIDNRPDARCVGCWEEGQWCYVTGIGYVCSTCRACAREEDREEREEEEREEEDREERNDDDTD